MEMGTVGTLQHRGSECGFAVADMGDRTGMDSSDTCAIVLRDSGCGRPKRIRSPVQRQAHSAEARTAVL